MRKVFLYTQLTAVTVVHLALVVGLFTSMYEWYATSELPASLIGFIILGAALTSFFDAEWVVRKTKELDQLT